jgi:hypothetical protein
MGMPESSNEQQRSPSFSKDTVDRWQVFGGIAGVAGLILALLGYVKDFVPLLLLVSIAMVMGGSVLLYRWGRRREVHPGGRLSKALVANFLIPLLTTCLGAGLVGSSIERNVSLPAREHDGARKGSSVQSTSTGVTSTDVTEGVATSQSSPIDPTTSVQGSSPAVSAAKIVPKVWRDDALSMTIHYQGSVDFDSQGDNRGSSSGRPDGYDILFDSNVYFPGSAALIEGVPEYEDCRKVTGLQDEIDGRLFKKDKAFCIKTTEGRLVRAVVVSSSYADVLVLDSIVVWDRA